MEVVTMNTSGPSGLVPADLLTKGQSQLASWLAQAPASVRARFDALLDGGKEADHAAPLRSWHEGQAKDAILAFVQRVSEPGSPHFVAVEERIAVFDNDGTLWAEKPLVVQLAFTLERLGELAKADPDLQTQQPYKSAYDHDFSWLNQAIVKHYNGDDADFALLGRTLPAAFAGLTIEDYFEAVKAFFRVSDHPTLKRPYSTIGYQPMTELIDYLEAHGFTVYITCEWSSPKPLIS